VAAGGLELWGSALSRRLARSEGQFISEPHQHIYIHIYIIVHVLYHRNFFVVISSFHRSEVIQKLDGKWVTQSLSSVHKLVWHDLQRETLLCAVIANLSSMTRRSSNTSMPQEKSKGTWTSWSTLKRYRSWYVIGTKSHEVHSLSIQPQDAHTILQTSEKDHMKVFFIEAVMYWHMEVYSTKGRLWKTMEDYGRWWKTMVNARILQEALKVTQMEFGNKYIKAGYPSQWGDLRTYNSELRNQNSRNSNLYLETW